MPSINRRLEPPILLILGAWGLISAFQGAGLSMFVSGLHQYRDTAFIELVYDSVIVAVMIALVSPRVSAALSLIAGLVAAVVVLKTNAFGHGAASAKSLLWAIVLRPGVTAVLLSLLPMVGPIGRRLWQGSAKTYD
jgi:hypothetical protein